MYGTRPIRDRNRNSLLGRPLADRLGPPLISLRETPEPSECGSPEYVQSYVTTQNTQNEFSHPYDLGHLGRQRADELNKAKTFDGDVSSDAGSATTTERSTSVRPAINGASSQTRAFWRDCCEQAKARQEDRRAVSHFKDRLSDPRVAVTMRELWNDAIEYHGRHCASLKKPFLLSSRRIYTPVPLATCRIQPGTGLVTLRKDVRVILEKGICRTEKLDWTSYHSLISFKSNDLAACYVRVMPRRPLIVLFMTRYEGAVVFFFSETIALRVILVLMQTKFVERLHSAVPENDIGIYAMQVFATCGEWLDEFAGTKEVFRSKELLNTAYEAFFSHSKYPEEEDNWSEDDSETESMADEDLYLDLRGKTQKRRRSDDVVDDELDAAFVVPRVQDVPSTTINGNGIEVLTKKQREKQRLERLLAQRSLLDEEIAKQQEAVAKTVESFEEIEDRIARISARNSTIVSSESQQTGLVREESVVSTAGTESMTLDAGSPGNLMDL